MVILAGGVEDDCHLVIEMIVGSQVIPTGSDFRFLIVLSEQQIMDKYVPWPHLKLLYSSHSKPRPGECVLDFINAVAVCVFDEWLKRIILNGG